MVTVDPRTVIVRPAMAVDPVAEGVPLTEDVELINVDVRLKIESNEMARLLRVAVPSTPLAVSVNRPVVNPRETPPNAYHTGLPDGPPAMLPL